MREANMGSRGNVPCGAWGGAPYRFLNQSKTGVMMTAKIIAPTMEMAMA